jgi:hypothetical protein
MSLTHGHLLCVDNIASAWGLAIASVRRQSAYFHVLLSRRC